jgi:hypothetical protein
MAGVSVPPEVFDDDYLYFYADILGDERSDADADRPRRGRCSPTGLRSVADARRQRAGVQVRLAGSTQGQRGP